MTEDEAVNLWLARFGERLEFGVLGEQKWSKEEHFFWVDVYRVLEKRGRIVGKNSDPPHLGYHELINP